MRTINRFHPGVYIKNSLEAMEMTSREFSTRTGISERTLSGIINGKCNITFDVAFKLSKFFDNSISYWINLQTQYDVFMNESNEEAIYKKDLALVKDIKKYLLEYSYILEEDSDEVIVEKARKLAGVNSLSLLDKFDPFVCFKEQYFQSQDDFFYKNFWLALALNEARKKKENAYNRKLLLSYIDEIRSLTVKGTRVFYPRLQEIFKECGIAFVLLPYLNKSNIYGATKWFSKDNVMLALSNRGEKAHLFWFTLFHEISHVLMEHRREMLISAEDDEDETANKMAEDFLIPRDKWNGFILSNDFSLDSIKSFSKEVGILPSIVLGRLHKENKVPYGTYDKTLNVSYKIVSIK